MIVAGTPSGLVNFDCKTFAVAFLRTCVTFHRLALVKQPPATLGSKSCQYRDGSLARIDLSKIPVKLDCDASVLQNQSRLASGELPQAFASST
jgi:hypothetical protein